ncbi:hypothetical protein MKJ01_06865 [Chryseobacterium sp. SSA4.19]|uniref:hypothetical protein n=1 Tax=Chryseobacterium sp. SSA4.19 TaxID=2919915 RepID=UPI001F4EC824|nr:hypothetical protein [Chryseobacterium sp. SSA4.19]MCJ8153484.1 hypothetical protein [Chryseobacterium sp. SSA4.19]
MNTLIQKNGRNSKLFEIQEDGIFVKDNFAKELREYKVYFSDIHDDESVIGKSKDFVLIAIAVSVLFNAILLTILINDSYNLSVSTGMIVFITIMIPVFIIVSLCNNEFRNENSKMLSAVKPLIFSYTNKEIDEVDSFISKIKESKKEYFLKIYYKVDNLIPVHIQISRIHLLYENKYINESDAKFIIEQLETKRIIEGL